MSDHGGHPPEDDAHHPPAEEEAPNNSWGWGCGIITVILLVLVFFCGGLRLLKWTTITLLFGVGALGGGSKKEATPPPPAARVMVEYPRSGDGYATNGIGLKAWLDPKLTYVRPSRPAKYVFIKDPQRTFDDISGSVVDKTPHHNVWLEMPEGEYMVYPLYPLKDNDWIHFQWWQ